MKRRELIKNLGLAAGAAALPGSLNANLDQSASKRSWRIAHITDVHLRPELKAPDRFQQCLETIQNYEVDFFLNSGDSIFAADYDDITRDRVKLQWQLWHEAQKGFNGKEVFSCLGNHDMWWAASDKNDPMYGKDHAVKQLGMPYRYYSFQKSNWHFLVLDSNNHEAGSLDKDQFEWLKKELEKIGKNSHVLIMSHYPILAGCTHIDGGNHTDSKSITKLFYQFPGLNIHCISGHIHLMDHVEYNGVNYYCNGALSGFWWGEGNEDSAGKYWYHETPPGFAIIDLYDDGQVINKYVPHLF